MTAELLALRPGAERLRSLVMVEWDAATPDVGWVCGQMEASLATAKKVLATMCEVSTICLETS